MEGKGSGSDTDEEFKGAPSYFSNEPQQDLANYSDRGLVDVSENINRVNQVPNDYVSPLVVQAEISDYDTLKGQLDDCIKKSKEMVRWSVYSNMHKKYDEAIGELRDCREKLRKEQVPPEKNKMKKGVKYDYKTRGWVRFKESDVDKKHIFHGTLKEMKVKTMELGVAGLVNWIDQRGGWEASPIQENHQKIHESLIHHIYKWPHTTPGWKPDVLITPGAPLHSIKKKIKEGFVVEFENPHDAREMDQLMGVFSGYKKKKRKKRSSKKKKKSKRSSKKRSSKRKKSRRRK